MQPISKDEIITLDVQQMLWSDDFTIITLVKPPALVILGIENEFEFMEDDS